MAGRKKKVDEVLKEQESRKADLGVGREIGSSLRPDAGPERRRGPLRLLHRKGDSLALFTHFRGQVEMINLLKPSRFLREAREKLLVRVGPTGARWSEKQLHRRFREVQLSDVTHQSAFFNPTTTRTKPSRIHRLDSVVVDRRLPASDTLPGGIKPA